MLTPNRKELLFSSLGSKTSPKYLNIQRLTEGSYEDMIYRDNGKEDGNH